MKPASNTRNEATTGLPTVHEAKIAIASLSEAAQRGIVVKAAIHLQNQGFSIRKAADAVGVDIVTLSRQIRRLKEMGPAGLLDGRFRSGRRKRPTRRQTLLGGTSIGDGQKLSASANVSSGGAIPASLANSGGA